MEESKKSKKKKKQSRRLFSDEAEAAVVKRDERIQKAVEKGLRDNQNTSTSTGDHEVAISRRQRRKCRDQSTPSQSSSQDIPVHILPPAKSNNDAPSSNAEYKDEKKKKKSKSKTKRFFSDEAEAAQTKKDERIQRAVQKEEKRQLQRSIKEEERIRHAEEEIQNDGGSQNYGGKPTKSRRTFGEEIKHTKERRVRRLQTAVEKEKKKIVKKIEKTQGAEAAEAIVFRDDYEKAREEEQRIETEQKTHIDKQSDVGDDIGGVHWESGGSNGMEEQEASVSARIDLSSASLNTRRSVATRRLFEPFPSARRERRKIKPCALVDWINVAWKKTAVLVHPRLMVNDLSTEQAAEEPRDDAR